MSEFGQVKISASQTPDNLLKAYLRGNVFWPQGHLGTSHMIAAELFDSSKKNEKPDLLKFARYYISPYQAQKMGTVMETTHRMHGINIHSKPTPDTFRQLWERAQANALKLILGTAVRSNRLPLRVTESHRNNSLWLNPVEISLLNDALDQDHTMTRYVHDVLKARQTVLKGERIGSLAKEYIKQLSNAHIEHTPQLMHSITTEFQSAASDLLEQASSAITIPELSLRQRLMFTIRDHILHR